MCVVCVEGWFLLFWDWISIQIVFFSFLDDFAFDCAIMHLMKFKLFYLLFIRSF